MTEQQDAVIGGVSFEFALKSLKEGARVRRTGWNGTGMWLTLSPGGRVDSRNLWAANNRRFAELNRDGCAQVSPYITMKTAGNEIVPWVASHTDLLSEDWEVLRQL